MIQRAIFLFYKYLPCRRKKFPKIQQPISSLLTLTTFQHIFYPLVKIEKAKYPPRPLLLLETKILNPPLPPQNSTFHDPAYP